MFVLSEYSNWAGGTCYSQLDRVTDRFDFVCYILDTDDLVNERYTRKELEVILRACPDIKIQGVIHENGMLKSIYAFRMSSSFVVGKYALIAECRTDRGQYAKCRLYKRGVGLVHKWETPHKTHYDWSFDFRVRGNLIEVVGIIETHDDRDPEVYYYNFEDTTEGIKTIKEPTQKDVDRGFQEGGY